jgi:patatin-like phospholipase/acyl hydrolase
MAKKILTIDGGGIRGVFSAAIIEVMERALGTKAKDYFDCLYGTSTGAILAAGLAKGMAASELKQFYIDKGAKVFAKLPFYRIIKRNLFWTYSKEALAEELRAVFKETKLFDIDMLLSIQVKDTETGSVVFYNNFPKTKTQNPERNGLIRDIIRASTAAPTYFQSHGNRYIDGGISSYNNSSYAAYIGISIISAYIRSEPVTCLHSFR